MAYQPKSYRKFLVGAVSTAVVASSFAGVAGAAANFTDVNSNYKEAVDYLVSKGINGTSATTFGTYDKITRLDAAIFVAKALELNVDNAPDAGFKDVPANRAKYVNALKAAKITNGKSTDSFGAYDNITRGELAKWLVTGFGLKGSADISAFNDVPANYADAVKTLVSNKITSGTTTTTFGTYDNAKRGDFAVFVKKSADAVAPAVDPKVESVSAINSKQLQVTFTQPVDKDTVISGTDDLVTANIKFSRTTVSGTATENANETAAKAKLSDDKKTLTITVAGANYLNGNYSVTATGLKSNDQKIPDYATVIAVKDETAPTVKSAVYNPSTGKFELELSEPVTQASVAAGTFRINGVPVVADAVVNYTSKVTVTRPAAVALGSTASVYFAGAQDFKLNNITPFTGNVVVTNDTTQLQVTSLKQTSSNKFRVVFNKAVAGANAAAAEADLADSILVVKDGTAVAGANITVTRVASDTDNKTFDVTIAAAANLYATGASSQDVLVTLSKETITDVTGNKNALYSQSLTMTRDITGPTIASAKLASDSKAIELTLNEAIDPAAASIDPTKFVIRKDGTALTAITAAQVSVKANSDDKVLVVKPIAADVNADGTLKAGTYTVRLEAGAIKDVDGNLNDGNTAQNVSTTETNDLKATGFATAAANQYEVTFSEAVSAASALNPANYTIDGVALNSSTADVYFKAGSSEKVVVVKLAEGTVNVTDTGSLGVSGVQTPAGKTVVSNYGIVNVTDNTSAKLVSATIIGTNVLKLTFDENIGPALTAANILGDIEVKSTAGKLDTTGAVLTGSISGKDAVITITGGATTLATVINGATLTVKTLDTGVAPADIDGKTDVIVDANGYKAKAGITVVPTKQ
jgi:hypothetical protein